MQDCGNPVAIKSPLQHASCLGLEEQNGVQTVDTKGVPKFVKPA